MRTSGQPATSRLIDPTVGLFVSLYFIIIAFFIVMNVISNQETARSKAAMESLEEAFERPFEAKAKTPGLIPPGRHSQSDSEYISQVGHYIAEVLGPSRTYPAEGGNILVYEVGANALFFSQSARLSEQAGVFFEKMAALVQEVPQGDHRSIAFVFGQKGDDGSLAYRRANSLAQAMVRAGVPASSLVVGLDALASGREIAIRLRTEKRPDFSRVGG
ncbi:hypothetical protein JCM17844_03860 [Iodidimonas gelatinilytica]|uniref:Motility protein B-like N-terminal domain-containing protein n=1 Tax=Iodidimonas gelatinilytica TaxID=1236966 RepID=A0A5A7MPK5_9PROT|nr:hypothetical protein [Iodidimonas gelatinilytica]GEQ96749.1 hypothetical protein JCM17844_03860 [Iodidimonas gelatinilytica]